MEEEFPVDNKQLKDLMDYLASSNFAEFEMEREGFKLRLVKRAAPVPADPAQPAAEAGAPPPVPVEQPAVPDAAAAAAANGDLEAITSPMVGTFYRASAPNADPYVEIGDVVESGQVICIVEAMKLMNEIEADRGGQIAEIPVANGQPVEFGETLFRIRPT